MKQAGIQKRSENELKEEINENFKIFTFLLMGWAITFIISFVDCLFNFLNRDLSITITTLHNILFFFTILVAINYRYVCLLYYLEFYKKVKRK